MLELITNINNKQKVHLHLEKGHCLCGMYYWPFVNKKIWKGNKNEITCKLCKARMELEDANGSLALCHDK